MSQKDELDTLFFGSSMDESQQERGDDEIQAGSEPSPVNTDKTETTHVGQSPGDLQCETSSTA